MSQTFLNREHVVFGGTVIDEIKEKGDEPGDREEIP